MIRSTDAHRKQIRLQLSVSKHAANRHEVTLADLR